MKSAFDIQQQQGDPDSKLVIAFEKMAELFRVLLWEKGKVYGLSPIQIQLLIFIAHHEQNLTSPAQLAKAFNLTRPTISDAIKSLVQKGLMTQKPHPQDARSKQLQLSEQAQELLPELEQFPAPLLTALASLSAEDKGQLLEQMLSLLGSLSDTQLISKQRMCYQCRFYEGDKMQKHHCQFLQKDLAATELRIDCPEYEVG